MKSLRRLSVATLFFTLWCSGIRAQTAQWNPTSEAANAAYDAKDWPKAAQLYKALTAADDKNGRAWYRLGISLHKVGQNQEAIQAFEKAIANGVPNFLVEYQCALALASLSQNDQAFRSLEKAVTDGFAQPDDLSSAPELATLRGDPRFAKSVAQAEHNLKPCAYAIENHQFDFWIGEWDVVTTEGGVTAGSSRIEKILNDCVVLENWTSANAPYQGKSYNTYNTNLKRWEQFWADNSQGMIHFYGNLKDGVMDYWTDELPQPDGKKLKRHLQFIPQGSDKLRQFSQGSYDDGKTWFVEYDLTYVKKK